MSEEFRIYGTFGYGATVYGNILAMLAYAIRVYNLGKELLTHTTLTGYQHSQVSLCHLHGRINGPEQNRVIANYSKLLLYFLYFRRIHRFIAFCDKNTYLFSKNGNFGRKFYSRFPTLQNGNNKGSTRIITIPNIICNGRPTFT